MRLAAIQNVADAVAHPQTYVHVKVYPSCSLQVQMLLI